MKTLAQHEHDILEAARQRAHQNNLRDVREERRQLTELQLSIVRNKVQNLEMEAKAISEAQKLPTFDMILKVMQAQMAHFIEPHLREKALQVARDLLEGAEVEFGPVNHTIGMSTTEICDVELVVVFMEPKDYHLRRSIAKPR